MGKLRNFLILFIFVSLITAIGAGATLSSDSYTLEYGSGVNLQVEKASPGETGEIDVCGGGLSIEASNPETTNKQLEVPGDAPCSYGEHTIQVTGDGGDDTATLEVTSKDMEPHISKYLYVRMNKESDDKLYNFLMSDTGWSQTNTLNSGLGIQEVDDGIPGNLDTCFYSVFEGKIGNSLNSIVDSEEHGGCSANVDGNGPGDVLATSFGPGDGTTHLKHPNIGGFGNPFHSWNLNDWTPVHSEGVYRKDGGIIYGNYPTYYDEQGNEASKSGDGPYFFICRDGATMDSGFNQEIDQVVKAGSTLYQCNPSTNEWVQTYRCSDGLDNDGDGRIDHDSESPSYALFEEPEHCPSPDAGSEELTGDVGENIESGECPSNFVGFDTSTGEKVAYYDSGHGSENPFGNDCNYKTQSASDVSVNSPHRFTCEYIDTDGDGVRDTGVSTSSRPKTGIFCNSVGELGDAAFHDDSVDAVKYYVPPDSVPISKAFLSSMPDSEYQSWTLPSGKTIIDHDILTKNFVMDSEEASKYVRNSAEHRTTDWSADGLRQECRQGEGLVLSRCETVHMAEKEYFGNSPGTDIHDRSYWDLKEMTDTSGYDQAQAEGSGSAWIVSNAAANDAEISGGATLLDPEAEELDPYPDPGNTFSGGFAGKCEHSDAKWTEFNAEWQCSKQVAEMRFQFFSLAIDGNDVGDHYVGMRVPRETIQTWKEVYTGAPPLEEEELQIQTQCWEGTYTERPSDQDKLLNMINEADSSQEPIYTVGNISDRDNTAVDADGDQITPSTYSCIYGLQQRVESASEVTPGTEVYIESGGSVTEVTGSSPGYIVEGTSDEGQIRHTNETIDLGPELPEVRFYRDANPPGPRLVLNPGCKERDIDDNCIDRYPTEQEWLENTAGNTTTTTDELWQNFPEGLGSVLGNPLPEKDPEVDFLDTFVN